MEKIVRPAFKEMKNRNEETPYVVFARTHEELRTKGEKWMIDTANYSMVVATLIGSTMFSGLIADGLDRSYKYYLAFSVASAIALFSSSTSLVMFLSILTSEVVDWNRVTLHLNCCHDGCIFYILYVDES